MDSVEATLYPRYLPHNIPNPHQPVTLVGMIVDIR